MINNCMPKHIRKTVEQVISEFKSTHGERYDYSEVEYISNNTKVKIICKKHGVFYQLPTDHKRGSGCSYCSRNKKISQEEFLSRVKDTHGNNYDFGESTYKSSKEKVKVICNKHGEFFTTPSILLSGSGCKKCGYEQQVKTKIEQNSISDPKLKNKFDIYRDNVRKLSNDNYQKFYYDINPNNLSRGKDYHLDHKFSILDGFLSDKLPEEIAHPSNLQIISAKENRSKGSKSYIDEYSKNKEYKEVQSRKSERISNKYKIYDIVLNKELLINSITQWCKDNNFSVSSVRWAANYQSTPFKKQYIIEKI